MNHSKEEKQPQSDKARSPDNKKPVAKPLKEHKKDDDKFSPGEPDDYNAEEFSTD